MRSYKFCERGSGCLSYTIECRKVHPFIIVEILLEAARNKSFRGFVVSSICELFNIVELNMEEHNQSEFVNNFFCKGIERRGV